MEEKPFSQEYIKYVKRFERRDRISVMLCNFAGTIGAGLCIAGLYYNDRDTALYGAGIYFLNNFLKNATEGRQKRRLQDSIDLLLEKNKLQFPE